MAKFYHMGISIPGALKQSDKKLDGIITKDGYELSAKAVRKVLKEHAAEGYKVFTGCENIDSEGNCLGHEKEFNGKKFLRTLFSSGHDLHTPIHSRCKKTLEDFTPLRIKNATGAG